MEELLKSLGLDGRVFLIQVAGFVILVVLLRKFLFGPVSAMLAARQDEIKSTYDRADESIKAAEQLKADYEQRIGAVEAEARQRIQEAVKEAQAAKDEIVSEARAESHAIIERGAREIEHERDRALVELRTEVANLAVGAAGKIIGENMDDARQRKLVDDFMKQVGRA